MKFISSEKISRRSFLKNGFRLSVLALGGIGYERRNNLKTEHLNLGFPNLPPSFHGFRIIQISDLHAGFWVSRDYLMEVVREINKLKKDLVVITGDIITGSVNNFWKRWMPKIKNDYSVHLAAFYSDQRPISLSGRVGQRTLWIHLCQPRNWDPCVSLSTGRFARDYLFYITKIWFCIERSPSVDCTFKPTKKFIHDILDSLDKLKVPGGCMFPRANPDNPPIVDFRACSHT